MLGDTLIAPEQQPPASSPKFLKSTEKWINAQFGRVRAKPWRPEPSNNSPSSLTVKQSYE